MSDLQLIQGTVQRATRRRRWLNAGVGLGWGMLIGGALWLLVFGTYKLFPLPRWILLATMTLGIALLWAGFLLGLLRRVPLLATAQWLDLRLHSNERLSTALEFAGDPRSGEWKELLLRDAAGHARSVDLARLLPWRFPIVVRWALLVVLLGLSLGFVPEYRTPTWRQQQQSAAIIRDTGKRLAELTRKTLVQKPPALPVTAQALEEVAQVGEKLANVNLTRSESLRELTNVREKVEQGTRPLSENPALKPLEKAARDSSLSSASPQDMQKQLEGLQDKLGKGAASEDKLEQLRDQLQKLQQAAAGMPDQNSPAGAAAREQMAAALAEAARQAEEMGLSLASLDEAMQALKAGQSDLFLRDLQATLNDLDKLREMARALQQLQQQMAQIGKDLAEQLQHGQVRAAQASLQKMIEQLQSANLTPEQMNQILDEVSKAVAPAGEYGKVQDLLRDAARQMKSGEKPGAAQSLADAKKELENLLQQMADAQALRELLDSLARAEAAIAMNKNWDEVQSNSVCKKCNGAGCSLCRGRKPGWSHGGKPGAGVGTWAEELGWTYLDETGPMPDNSSVQRPEMDPRGHSERPDQLSPDLNPTKVRGKMSPGGSMPSITLKGVSIKGSSNVKFEEAAAAAQADAQNALNQDKIPRAYQNAVKDYFDDLKK